MTGHSKYQSCKKPDDDKPILPNPIPGYQRMHEPDLAGMGEVTGREPLGRGDNPRQNTCQRMRKPPSTASGCPWTNEDSSEHSHSTAAAISSVVPNLFMGWRLAWNSISSGFVRVTSSNCGVMTEPGHTALMRTPFVA